MNGEVVTINMLEKISWERFKTLKPDLQAEYLQTLMNRFGTGLSTIGVDLFNLGKSSLGVYVSKHNLKLSTRTGGRMSRAAWESWKRWLDYEDKIAPTDDPAPAPITEVPEEPQEDLPVFRAHDYDDMFKDIGMERDIPAPSVPAPATFPATGLSITLEGTPSEILSSLIAMVPTVLDFGKPYRFNLKVDTYLDFTRRNDL